jgi:hypothetical protein
VAHGAYDFMGSFAELRLLEIGSMVSFMLSSLFFFRKLRELRDGGTDQFSIAGTFVLGIAILCATIIVLASREIGFMPALASLAITGFLMIMVGYMFYWQLGEGMSAEAEEGVFRPYAT